MYMCHKGRRYTPVHRVRVDGRSLPHATAGTRETRLRTAEHSILEDSIGNSPYGSYKRDLVGIVYGSESEAENTPFCRGLPERWEPDM